jgi:peptide methionine sulfoxide reductase MsrA
MVDYSRAEHKTSISQACLVIGYSRSGIYYQSRKQDQVVQEKLQEWAEKKPTERFWNCLAEL